MERMDDEMTGNRMYLAMQTGLPDDVTAGANLVLLVLELHAPNDGDYVYPDDETIAQLSKLSLKTVKRSIAQLIKRHRIEPVTVDGKRGYRLLPPYSAKAADNASEPVHIQNDPKPQQTPGTLVWNEYARCYRERYGADPIRNAKQNSLCAELVKRLHEDAVPVVTFYLDSNNLGYGERIHSLPSLVRNAEKIHTEWKLGRQIAFDPNAWMSDKDKMQVEKWNNSKRWNDSFKGKEERDDRVIDGKAERVDEMFPETSDNLSNEVAPDQDMDNLSMKEAPVTDATTDNLSMKDTDILSNSPDNLSNDMDILSENLDILSASSRRELCIELGSEQTLTRQSRVVRRAARPGYIELEIDGRPVLKNRLYKRRRFTSIEPDNLSKDLEPKKHIFTAKLSKEQIAKVEAGFAREAEERNRQLFERMQTAGAASQGKVTSIAQYRDYRRQAAGDV